MLTDEQVAEIVETTYPCEWETDYDPCNPTCALCLKRSTCALLSDRAELVAKEERLQQLSIDLHACMVEARHKWGLEQDKNERLWAVVDAAKAASYYVIRYLPQAKYAADKLDAALAALDKEATDETR